jgi:outer membrane lipoprotein-sorting protein
MHLVGASTIAAVLMLVLLCTVSRAFEDISPTEFERLLRDMNQAYAQIDHYTATFLIQERVDGDLVPTQRVVLKFKKPFKVYMRWLTGKHEGRQALYPAGVDGKDLLVRLPILIGAVTVSLDPQSPRARKGGRHPITDVGIGRLLDLITENSHRGLQRGELTSEDGGDLATFARPTHRYILHFPTDPTEGYYCMTALIDVDREHRLPIYAEIFDWNGQLVERYGYIDLRLNAGLTDQDFDSKNPNYGF